jgi:hypothetical protein
MTEEDRSKAVTRKKRLLLRVLVAAVCCATVAYPAWMAVLYVQWVQPEETIADESISADGMFRCEVRETVASGRSTYLISFQQRVGGYRREDASWRTLNTSTFDYDSVSMSNCSIDWQYDDRMRPKRLRVYADDFNAPVAGTLIWDVEVHGADKSDMGPGLVPETQPAEQ